VAMPAAYVFDRQQGWVWSQAPESAVQRTLARLRWRDLHPIAQSSPGAMVLGAQDVSWTYGLQSDEDVLFYMTQPAPGASVTLCLPATMEGALLDPEAGHEVRQIRIEMRRPWDIRIVALPPGRDVVLMLSRVR
jgi:hypothetical protein